MSPSPNRPDALLLDPGLYVVATPIGNLRDITLRALDVLSGVDLILAEDTRSAAKLLSAHRIGNRVERYDDHVGDAAGDGGVRARVLARLAAGERVALISDAGTPLVSDPGYRLVREAAAQGTAVIPLPGASALLAGLSVAGLATDRFLFAGFPPSKSAARRTLFEELSPIRATLIFYESGPRVADSLADMVAVFGARDAVVCRELTKLYETVIRAPLPSVSADPRLQTPKGEIVVLVAAGEAPAAGAADVDAALAEALARLGPSGAAAEVARALGLPRHDLYRRALTLKGA